MATKNLHSQERIATRRLLGIDTKGREHRWDMVTRTLYVLEDGDVTHTEHVGDRSLGDWVAFVETRVGWETLHYSARPFESIEVLG